MPSRRTTAFVLSLAIAGWATTVTERRVEAAPKKTNGPSQKSGSAPSAELAELKKQLDGDEDTAAAALDSIADSEKVEAAPLVREVLERGGTPKVIDAALKAAGKLKESSLSAAVAPYVAHRSEEIRRAAIRTLIKTKGPAAVTALKAGLHSEDPGVRGTAATGLGALGVKDAMPDLFKAFDHGVAEAGAAIGQLCNEEECRKFSERTGHVAFDVMETGFDQILFRPSNEVSDEEKIRLVGSLRELGTPEVGKYLSDVADRWPKDWSKKVKQAIEAASHAVVGGSKK